MQQPSINSRHNPDRGCVSYQVRKEGTSQYLIFDAEELRELQRLIGSALGGVE